MLDQEEDYPPFILFNNSVEIVTMSLLDEPFRWLSEFYFEIFQSYVRTIVSQINDGQNLRCPSTVSFRNTPRISNFRLKVQTITYIHSKCTKRL